MSFLRRAKSMHERGDAVRAAIILTEGLKRDPSDGEALEWLLHLYVEELPNPGIEAELVRILAAQPNGSELYRIVESELGELGHGAKLKALERVGGREAVLPKVELPAHELPEEPASPAPHTPAASPAVEPIAAPQRQPGADDDESWDSFDNPIEARRRTGRSTAVASDEAGQDETRGEREHHGDASESPWDDRPAELTFDDEPWDEPTTQSQTNLWWWVGGVVGALALIVVLALTLFADPEPVDVDGEFAPEVPEASESEAGSESESEGSSTGDSP